MRMVAVTLLALSATTCQVPPDVGRPPGSDPVLLAVELFESSSRAPDLGDRRQALSLGRQELASWDSGTAVYQARASVVSTLPDQGLRASRPAEAGATGRDAGVALPAGYQNAWLLRLELRPTQADGRWSADGVFQVILDGDRVALEKPVELAADPAQVWLLALGRSASSGGYLHARVEVLPQPPADG